MAIGPTPAPRAVADLLTVVATHRLAKIDLLLDGSKYGKGDARSVRFYIEPVPSERDEDTGEDA